MFRTRLLEKSVPPANLVKIFGFFFLVRARPGRGPEILHCDDQAWARRGLFESQRSIFRPDTARNFRPIFRRRPGRGPKRPQKVTGWTSRVSQFRQSKAICLLFRSLGGPCWWRRGPSWGRVWAILGDLGGVSMLFRASSGLRLAVSKAVAVVSKGFCGIVR